MELMADRDDDDRPHNSASIAYRDDDDRKDYTNHIAAGSIFVFLCLCVFAYYEYQIAYPPGQPLKQYTYHKIPTREKPKVRFVKPEIDEKQSEFYDMAPIGNETLGFGKIFAINLPGRLDRRDDMSLLASAAGLNVTMVDGVPADSVNSKWIPDVADYQKNMKNTHFACFRSHANVWRRMIQENLETALIIEDDVDFDLNIRKIMPQLRPALLKITGHYDMRSQLPFWDLLYLGTCWETPYEPTDELVQGLAADDIYQDVEADNENLSDQLDPWVEAILERYFRSKDPRRAIVKAKNPVCSHSYAITQSAARSLLLELNEWLPFPVDISMVHHITQGKYRAYTVVPPLFSQWRYVDNLGRNSDIDIDSNQPRPENVGFKRSTRKHLADWINVDTPFRPDWWKDVPLREGAAHH